MIIENFSYSLSCDDSACNNYFDGADQQRESEVIKDAESDGWMVVGQKCYCPEHRPNE